MADSTIDFVEGKGRAFFLAPPIGAKRVQETCAALAKEIIAMARQGKQNAVCALPAGWTLLEIKRPFSIIPSPNEADDDEADDEENKRDEEEPDDRDETEHDMYEKGFAGNDFTEPRSTIMIDVGNLSDASKTLIMQFSEAVIFAERTGFKVGYELNLKGAKT